MKLMNNLNKNGIIKTIGNSCNYISEDDKRITFSAKQQEPKHRESAVNKQPPKEIGNQVSPQRPGIISRWIQADKRICIQVYVGTTSSRVFCKHVAIDVARCYATL